MSSRAKTLNRVLYTVWVASLLLVVAASLWFVFMPGSTRFPEAPSRVSTRQRPDVKPCFSDGTRITLDSEFVDVNGNRFRLGALKGKVLLVNVWASWCAPCRTEIATLVDLQKDYSEVLSILGVSLDDRRDKVRAFALARKVNYPVGIGTDSDLGRAFGHVPALPTSLIMSRDGGGCKKMVGMTSKAGLEREIRTLLR